MPQLLQALTSERSGTTRAVIHCRSDYKTERGKVKLSNKVVEERGKVVPGVGSGLACWGRMGGSAALSPCHAQVMLSRLRFEGLLPWAWWDRGSSAGFGGVRQAKAEQIKDVHSWEFAWANFLSAVSGEVGLTWELVGLDGDSRCLAPGRSYRSCFLIAY